MVALMNVCHAGQERQKILIMYFSLTGNTIPVAEKLRELTGGDLYRIETTNSYPLERPARTEVPKRELESGIWPELKNPLPDFAQYDLILLGGPVWWYTVSNPLRSVLQQADFAGKRVAPFVTHDGGMGDYWQYFERNVNNGVVLKGIDLYRAQNETPQTLEQKLSNWLETFN
jgi:flavodoxin